MKIGRREFMQVSAAAGAGGLMARKVSAMEVPDPPQKAVLKLSCQESRPPFKTLPEKLDFLEQHGYVGLELHGGKLLGREEEIQKALQGRKIKISAVCGGAKGSIISDQESVRRKCVDSLKEILTAAGALGSTGVIMVPAFKKAKVLPYWEARKVIVELLKEVAEHAVSVKSRVLLEPLNRKEAHFLRLVADAAAICRDVGSPGVGCMGDFWHMTWEETSDMGAVISGGELLHHMHMASRKNRKMPGEDEGDNYIEGFRGLKMIGYQDYISLECGSKGDRKETIPAAAKLLRKQWEKA
ncbi:MAG: sugar phosphate isomerase/epimerase [Planctomycetes bacterium]|nr:sugar phosphate isomerase/epimerase [Planctomycetota bacterium]